MSQQIDIRPGRYVVAVSGGVDSVVLLDMLTKRRQVTDSCSFVVAHVDHGIRPESGGDLAFVRQLAAKYGLPCLWLRVCLGPDASEAQAREVRYAFLKGVQARLGFDAIVTAHHQDDLVETSVMNVMRGTGRRGLGAFGDSNIVRPLTGYTKAQLTTYARARGLAWHEDATNKDMRYRRNHLRHELLPRLEQADPAFRAAWMGKVEQAREANEVIDTLLQDLIRLHVDGDARSGFSLDRGWFASLPDEVAREVVAQLLRQAGTRELNRPGIERLTNACKTGKINTRYDVDRRWEFRIGQLSAERVQLTLAPK